MIRISSFEKYMRLPHRQLLTSAQNDGTINPRADDAGNWTGGVVGVGNLVGTYRDISAVAASAYYGYPVTVSKLRSIDYNEAKRIIKWIWDSIDASQIPDQDVANITMHIKMHFGNIQLVQKALNQLGERLELDGVMGPKTLAAIQRQSRLQPVLTYNRIRAQLKAAYEKSNPVYREGFMNVLKDFPKKASSMRYWIIAAIIIAAVAIAKWGYQKFIK
jgi:hypothetical protein